MMQSSKSKTLLQGHITGLLFVIFSIIFYQFGTQAHNCNKSVTLVRGQQACSGEVIFEENFDSEIDRNRWKHTVRISGQEGQEFVIYDKNPQNSYTRDGTLYIKPQLIEDAIVDSGNISLDGCTGEEGSEECSFQSKYFTIMPPVRSAELKSLPFSFRYGKVEVRAKMPFGDWIIPHIYMKPQFENWKNSSATVTVIKSHGNHDLHQGSKDIGTKKVTQFVNASYSIGGRYSHGNASVSWGNYEGWDENFHNYQVEWTPDHLIFGVDDRPKYNLRIMKNQHKIFGYEELEGPSLDSPASILPFEQEFYIAIAVNVGGMKEFADDVKNNEKPKPWSNNGSLGKARLNFWWDRDEWHSTWDDEKAALQVDYIKITAL